MLSIYGTVLTIQQCKKKKKIIEKYFIFNRTIILLTEGTCVM